MSVANTASLETGELLTVGTGGLQHVGDKSGADRSARLVLLVLASVGKVGTETVSSVCPVNPMAGAKNAREHKVVMAMDQILT